MINHFFIEVSPPTIHAQPLWIFQSQLTSSHHFSPLHVKMAIYEDRIQGRYQKTLSEFRFASIQACFKVKKANYMYNVTFRDKENWVKITIPHNFVCLKQFLLERFNQYDFDEVYKITQKVPFGMGIFYQAYSKISQTTHLIGVNTCRDNQIFTSIIKQINHDLMLCPIQVFQCEKQFYLVYQQTRFIPIRYLINNYFFDSTQIRQFLYDLAESLSNLHSLNIVSQGITPSSILYLTKQKKFVLSDFSHCSYQNSTISAQGIAGYAAPQALRSHKKVTCSADMFSLGVVLYEILMKKKLFNQSTQKEVFKANRTGSVKQQIEEVKKVQKEWGDILQQLLEYSAEKRISVSQLSKMTEEYQITTDTVSQTKKQFARKYSF